MVEYRRQMSGNNRLHITPTGEEHVLNMACRCNPEIIERSTGKYVFFHQSHTVEENNGKRRRSSRKDP